MVLKYLIFLLFLIMPLTGCCQEIGKQIAVPAQLIEKHSESKFGDKMYYLYQDKQTIYIVMHGTESGMVMNGISTKTALNNILQFNKDKLEYFSTIKIICCYSNKHKNFFSKKWNVNVEFPVNSDKKLIVRAGKRGFKYAEWID